MPFPAIDPRTGELYLAYEGTDFTGGAHNQIQLVHSLDGGRSWSAPSRVNAVPTVPAFTPSIAITERGDVGITYYDVRTLTPGNTTTLPTSTWLTVSPRGGQHFNRERRLASSFDFLQAPNANGLFLGDYEGLATFDDQFRALFVTTNNGQPNNRNDVFFVQVRSSDVRAPVVTAAGTAVSPLRAPAAPHQRRVSARR